MSGTPSGDKPRRFPLRLDQVASTTARPTQSREVLRPQAPLEQAERDRRQHSIPHQGLGMDSRAVQRRMIERLYADGIRHQRLLDAFNAIPRHWFVDSALVNQAYEDTSLPIGLGQTISKPSVIGSMIELLCVRPGLEPDAEHPLGHCLDIGTGCGYQAALLSCLSRRVVSMERLRDLHLKARTNLDRLRQGLPQWQDVRLVYGDGMLGHPPNAPYDTIIAAAGGAAVPQAWLDQLAPGGRLVAPTEDSRSGTQVLTIIDRLPNGQLQQVTAGQVLFVPLKSGMT
jgi:protein-L-isoaspartate(D-aspartate) O-methyltransferase